MYNLKTRDTFDCINYRIFFDENNWDTNEARQLHKSVKIKNKKRFFRKKWMPSTETSKRGTFERRKKKFVVHLADQLMTMLIDDMLEKGNKIIFRIENQFGGIKGWSKIGVFKEDGILMNFEQLIFSIVPHKEEMLGEYYPVIYSGPGGMRLLKKAWSVKNIEYENINVQERLAAHNRLSGFYRRVCKLAKDKKANIQGRNRFKSSNINDNKDSGSG